MRKTGSANERPYPRSTLLRRSSTTHAMRRDMHGNICPARDLIPQIRTVHLQTSSQETVTRISTNAQGKPHMTLSSTGAISCEDRVRRYLCRQEGGETEERDGWGDECRDITGKYSSLLLFRKTFDSTSRPQVRPEISISMLMYRNRSNGYHERRRIPMRKEGGGVSLTLLKRKFKSILSCDRCRAQHKNVTKENQFDAQIPAERAAA
jgi:hypothetical protein